VCKGGWCVGLTTLSPSCANCLEIWEPQLPGTLRACNGIALPVLQEIEPRSLDRSIPALQKLSIAEGLFERVTVAANSGSFTRDTSRRAESETHSHTGRWSNEYLRTQGRQKTKCTQQRSAAPAPDTWMLQQIPHHPTNFHKT